MYPRSRPRDAIGCAAAPRRQVEVGLRTGYLSMIDRWNSEMSCGTTKSPCEGLPWVPGDDLAIDGDVARLRRIKSTKRVEFPAAGRPTSQLGLH